MLVARVDRDSEPDFHRITLGTARSAEGAGSEPAVLIAIRPVIRLFKCPSPTKGLFGFCCSQNGLATALKKSAPYFCC